ncbi:MAG TPA: response regulator transcription factor, partial [Prosthecobacter sp.]|nr:response regulator transcription factor [Prosthecobacter sp.]
LLARAASCLRRRRHRFDPGEPVRFGDCQLHLESRQLFRGGREIKLRPKEWALLSYLVQHPGRALSRDHLLDAVWGRDLIVTQRSVDRCVTTLRKKIEAEPNNPRIIVTVRDCGYRFERRDEVEPCASTS